ncbi:hypothetical protein ACFSJ3_01490 [Corallincola platygyrae]|uniref:Lipoprotein n=1 Tax=Corallincola platygyrae TaxID=1193278 RepID=A0ABW4XIP0_9GAMM
MTKKISVTLMFLFAFSFLTGCKSTPVANLEGEQIPSGLTEAQFVKAVTEAGHLRGWVIKKESDGHLVGDIQVRSHYAAVDINYSASEYSITYKDSENLKYDGERIHRKYNQWISNLNLDIQKELRMLTL